jgi:hypothetical protein
MTPPPRVPLRVRTYVRPGLRGIGGLVIPNWLAITIGHSIVSWRKLDGAELEHELTHVRQWDRCGRLEYPIEYARASLRARCAGGHWYRDNAFEVEAYAAARSADACPARPLRSAATTWPATPPPGSSRAAPSRRP